MTRTYTTKHGAGPMPHELKEKPYVSILDDTNILNAWQQHPRYSYLNLDLLKQAIQKDLYSVRNNSGLWINPGIGLTCIDQVNSLATVGYILNNKFRYTDSIQDLIEKEIGIPITHFSVGPTRKDIMENKDQWK
jgi:adenylosuccinate synthase